MSIECARAGCRRVASDNSHLCGPHRAAVTRRREHPPKTMRLAAPGIIEAALKDERATWATRLRELRRLAQLCRIGDTLADKEAHALQIEKKIGEWLSPEF
jgi:hypothetical protein